MAKALLSITSTNYAFFLFSQRNRIMLIFNELMYMILNWYKKAKIINKLSQAKGYFFLDNAIPYLIDDQCKIIQVQDHLSGVMEEYDISIDQIAEDLGINQEDPEESLDQFDSNDYESTIAPWIKQFACDNNIFFVVVDNKNKQVYVRPNEDENPSRKQLKELSDWAIEQGYSEKIIIDYAVA